MTSVLETQFGFKLVLFQNILEIVSFLTANDCYLMHNNHFPNHHFLASVSFNNLTIHHLPLLDKQRQFILYALMMILTNLFSLVNAVSVTACLLLVI